MSLLLTLEQAPRSQTIRQTRLDQGEMVIGRSPDADWQIDDPDMFVSRAHCRITGRQDGYFVTDTSSSGLFIDDSDSPLGAGNSAQLRHGMRLRLGDYVLGVEMQGGEARPAAPQPPAGSRAPVNLDHDDFFSARAEPEPPRQRPSSLPDPFEQPKPGAYRNQAGDDNAPRSPAFDDPFSLDPVATPEPSAVGRGNGAEIRHRATPAAPAEPWSEKPPPRREPTTSDDGFGLGTPVGRSARASRVEASVAPAAEPPAPWDLPARSDSRAAPRQTPPAKAPARPQQAGSAGDTVLHAAFLRGAGMDEADASGRDPIADMEKFGREYRLMLEGLMQLLRKRAEEKGNARIEQTVVGASDVNPLKFLPTADDALATIFAERSPGFLSGEAAITDAVRDLAEHHVRAWRGVQAALRRMVDRFDPAALEEELKSGSTLGTLLSGGRGAKLWELYQKRHREIAQSAEQRFLGEIGADFRDAYEEE